jgi:UDP-N-acetylglucosamine 2-epimerase (non-hydrolysing)
MKTIMTITGIRPDFIRMSDVFNELDKNFKHILVHTGQHYDKLLSDIFFDDLNIRKPDFNLGIGAAGKLHYHQQAELSVKIIELIKEKNLKPDLILFLGDSNSVLASIALKKEGFKIGHIEAGMRSYDERMLEEINRIACDHVSSFLFVYHKNYRKKLIKENISKDKIFIVGNTIVEPLKKIADLSYFGKKEHILLDIHRPENFKYKDRLEKILYSAAEYGKKYSKPVKMLNFSRTVASLKNFSINIPENIEIIELMGYKSFIRFQQDSLFIISDSGTAQEEPALLNIPVIVPRDFTERPESVENGDSYMLLLNNKNSFEESINFINFYKSTNKSWLGDGNTSKKIIKILKRKL